jgi:hypothetical protein
MLPAGAEVIVEPPASEPPPLTPRPPDKT